MPLKVPPLRGERIVSWTQLDLLLGRQHQLFPFDSLPKKRSLTIVEWVIHIAAYGYKCEKKEEDLEFVARYPAVHNRPWIEINGSMWVRDSGDELHLRPLRL